MKTIKTKNCPLCGNDVPNNDTMTSTLSKTFNEYHLWLTADIEGPENYTNWFSILASAKETDQVIIHINSYGGDVDTGLQLFYAIKSCDAKVFISIEGACISCASMIAMAGENFRVNPLSYMMIHTSTMFIMGKENNIRQSIDFHKDWWVKVFRTIYHGFLTDTEIDEALNGKDIYMDSEEMLRRFKARGEEAHKEYEKASGEFEKFQKKIINTLKASKKFTKDEMADVEGIILGPCECCEE